MNKITSIALLIAVAVPVLGNSLLEFRLVQQEEKTGWNKTEFEGKQIWVSPICEIDAQHIASAELTWTGPYPVAVSNRQPLVSIVFTPEGSKLLEALTTNHTDHQLAVIYEGTILIAPTIREPIKNGMMEIFKSFTEAEAQNIVSKINSRKLVEPIN